MRILPALLVLLAGCGGCVSVPPLYPIARVSYEIGMPRGGCTGTAVAPHWIMTAAHCLFEGGPVIKVGDTPVKMLDVMLDGSDHALVRVDRTFDKWAPLGKSLIGDRVRIYGNPVIFSNVYRIGIESAVNSFPACPPIPGVKLTKCTVILFQMVTGPGDSGAGYFNDAGELVAVHTGTLPIGVAGLAYALPLAFTPAQMAKLAS